MWKNPLLSAAAIVFAVAVGAASPQDEPRFKAESQLVVLHVTVKDGRGSYVSGLTADAFRVIEKDRPQAIRLFATEDAPVTVGLVIDSSGSMLAARDRVIAASTQFVETSNPEDEVFALVFNEDVQPALASAAPFTSDAGVLRDALAGAFIPRGRTALFDAIVAGVEHTARGTRDRRVLVVLSDGGDNASRVTFADALTKVQASNVVIYTIALYDPLDADANPRRLKEFAGTSGGVAFSPDNVAQVGRAFQEISRDIRHGYTIGYEPTDAPSQATFHRIRVDVHAPDGRRLATRTRTGYFAGHVDEQSHAQ